MILKKILILFLTILSYAHGYDNRSPVYNLKELAAIGQLVAILPPNVPGFSSQIETVQKRFEENSRKKIMTKFNFCSAVLIISDKIATAGHCAETYNWLKKLNLKIEFVSADKEVKPVEIKSVFNMDAQIDWAILDLNVPMASVKPFQFFQLPKKYEQKVSLLSVGYPQTVRGVEYFGETLFSSSCKILEEKEKQTYTDVPQFKNDIYLTDCYATIGNSGGPVLLKADTGYYIIGINSFAVIRGFSVRALSVPARVILNAIKK